MGAPKGTSVRHIITTAAADRQTRPNTTVYLATAYPSRAQWEGTAAGTNKNCIMSTFNRRVQRAWKNLNEVRENPRRW
jgi:hypothetical protein